MPRPDLSHTQVSQILNRLEESVRETFREAFSPQNNPVPSSLPVVPQQPHQDTSTTEETETARLRRELQATREELKQAQAVAAAATRARCEFLAYMSHEIRTPMTAILGFTELLQNEALSDEDQNRAVKTIRRNSHYLLDVINEILELSRLESGVLEIEQLQVNPLQLGREVVDQLAEQSRALNNTIHLEIEGTVPETIQTDPTLLKQALVNLLTNALKLTTEGHIRLTLSCDPSQQAFCFRVSDTGMGIPTDQRQHVFQPFRQAAATTTGKRGKAGSGFTIISRIAELLQGEIRLEQDASEHSEFTFAIATGPLDQVRMLSSQEAGELDLPDPRSFSANSRLQGRILVVEDNLDNQRLIRFLLNRAGAEITIAANGQQGVDMALQSESPFDLILMDLQMPVLDGYQATIALRAAGYTGPIVALTAHALTGELERCLSVGFDDCLTKPIDRNVLIPQIAARLARKSTSVTR